MVDLFNIATTICSKIPPLVLFIFISTNYYLYFPGYANLISSPLLTAVITTAFALTMICYFRCLTSSPGTIPSFFDFLPDSSIIFLSNQEFVSNLSSFFVTFCEFCQRNRPARTHHCSVCNKCVLKRDHHCVWINNCVGLLNHKYFLLMLCYGCTASCLISCACGSLVVEDYENSDYWSGFGCAFNFITCMSLVFMSGYHLWLIFTNRIMYEMKYEIKANIFDYGAMENVRKLLGEKTWTYFLPVPCEVDEVFTDARLVCNEGKIKEYKKLAVFPEKN